MGDEPAPPTLLERARALFKERGPICDSEGFYQHTGECWNDGLQMIFLFTDGLKEYTQPFLLFRDFTKPEEIEDITEDLPEESKKYALIYLQMTQKRLVRHYLAEYERETCPTPREFAALQAISKKPNFRAKGAEAIAAAASGKGQLLEMYTTGGNFNDERRVIALFKKLLPPATLTTTVYTFYGKDQQFVTFPPDNLTKMIPFSLQALSPVRNGSSASSSSATAAKTVLAASLGGGDHAFALYRCNGVEYFYENTYGPFEFPWSQFLQFLAELNQTARPFTFSCYGQYTLFSGSQAIYRTIVYPILEVGESLEPELYTIFPDGTGIRKFTISETVRGVFRDFSFVFKVTTKTHVPYTIEKFNLLFGPLISLVPKPGIVGSRIVDISPMNIAYNRMNADEFEKVFSEEKAASLLLNWNDFQKGSTDGERILLKLMPFLPKLRQDYTIRRAIELDYPNYLAELLKLFPDALKKKRYRYANLLLFAIQEVSPKVVALLCKEPVDPEIYEMAADEIEAHREAGTLQQELFTSFQMCAKQGGGRRRKRMSRKQKRIQKKTRKVLRG